MFGPSMMVIAAFKNSDHRHPRAPIAGPRDAQVINNGGSDPFSTELRIFGKASHFHQVSRMPIVVWGDRRTGVLSCGRLSLGGMSWLVGGNESVAAFGISVNRRISSRPQRLAGGDAA